LFDERVELRAVVARENRGETDGRAGSLLLESPQHGLDATGDVLGLRVAAGLRADVVGAAEEDDDLGIHAVQLAVVEAPKYILECVGAPAEVGDVPAEEVLLPVGEVFGVGGVAGAPAAGDGVALDIDIDLALRAL